MGNNLAKKEIDVKNLVDSGSRSRPAVASIAEDNLMIEIVVVSKYSKVVRVWREKKIEL
jgi:hypothetical protein